MVRACFHVTLTLLLLVIHAASLEFNYQQLGHTGNFFNTSGDVKPQGGLLKLTNNEPRSYGRVIYPKLLHLWDKNSGKVTDFATHFSFTINAPNETHHADGLTFFLARPDFPSPDPRDGAGIGLASREQLLKPNYTKEHPFVAVEFDTYVNEWDPEYPHVGISVNSIGQSDTAQWSPSLEERVYNADISFNSSSNKLSVIFTGYKANVVIKGNLSSVVNLRDILPDWVEFGFSAATGNYYEEHALSSWSFNSSFDMEQQKGGSKRGLVIGLSVGLGVGVLIVILGVTFLVRRMLRTRDYLLRPTIRQAVQVLSFEVPLPTLTPPVPFFTNNTSFSSMASVTPPFANSQPVFSQSSSTLEVISPGAAYLHTY
ncbi:hypothetical protein VNO80_10897 [Phaseolus coccineus]|uniref:Legume lectin domain-containing protein n=1 Tax=Phaseolus coccineus TaxID=3886 RepID=A0AAN9N921_PHACN